MLSRGCHLYPTNFLFFFNDPSTTEIYTLSLHDALPICLPACMIESGSGRARIVKERRGSDAMARMTGLNRCSPLPLFWAGSCVFFPVKFHKTSGFLAHIVVRLHPRVALLNGGRPACSLFAMRSVSVVVG